MPISKKRWQKAMKPFFERWSKIHLATIRDMILRKKGAKGDKAPSNSIVTQKKKGYDHWLKDSDSLRKQGFAAGAIDMGYVVYAKLTSHPYAKDGKSYQEIIQEWGRGSKTKKYSGLFSQMPDQLFRRFSGSLNREMGKQVNLLAAESVMKMNKGFKK